jgi:alkylhydroperoxidase/carboxymuconolactone decarboxylase family protein YurZ
LSVNIKCSTLLAFVLKHERQSRREEEKTMLSQTDLNAQLTTFATNMLKGDSLSLREQAIAILSIALALEESEVVRQAIIGAKQADISNEEIEYLSAQVVALRGRKIARLVGAGQPLPQTKTVQSNAKCCQ